MSRTAAHHRGPRILAGAALLLLLILIGGYQFGLKRLPPTDPSALDTLDTQLFAELQQQFETFDAHADQLWDAEYRYDRKPLLLARTDDDGSPVWPYVYLVNMSSLIDTSGYAHLSFPVDGVLADVRVATDVDLQTLQLWMPGDFATLEFAGRRVLAFKYAPAQLAADPDPLSRFATYAMHEAFHINVQSGWRHDGEGVTRVFDAPTGEHLREAFADEFAALDEISTQTDHDALWRLAARLVDDRRREVARYPQVAARDSIETIEGTPRYLERRYSDIIGGRVGVLTNRQGATASFTSVLDWAASAQGDSGIFEYTIWYETGAQLGFLLDRLVPDWKTKLDDGRTTMADVLAEAVSSHR